MKYIQRLVIAVLILCMLGCVGGSGTCDFQEKSCVEKVTNDSFVLTSESPTCRLVGGPATLSCGAWFEADYQWADVPDQDTQGNKALTEAGKIRPTVTMKIGTLEHGVISNGSKDKPGLGGNGWWMETQSYKPPAKKNDGDTAKPESVNWVLSATLQQPLVKLPSGKGPNISLPFIGQVIGPKPKPVSIKLTIHYYNPGKERNDMKHEPN